MSAVTHDNGMVSFGGVFGYDVVGVLDQRAGGVHHFHTALHYFCAEGRRNAVRADDQHAFFVCGLFGFVHRGNLFGRQHVGHLFVVYQRAECVNGFFAGRFQLQHFVYGPFYARAKSRRFGNGHALVFVHIYIIGNPSSPPLCCFCLSGCLKSLPVDLFFYDISLIGECLKVP